MSSLQRASRLSRVLGIAVIALGLHPALCAQQPAAPAAAPAPADQETGPSVSYADQVYTYRHGEMEARLWVPYPAGGQPVRGVFQQGNAGRGSFLCWIEDPQFRRYAVQHGFGMCSTRGTWGADAYANYGKKLLEAYRLWAALGHHPELAHVPFVCTGNSSAGAFAYGFASLVPERVICFAANVPAGLVPEEPVPALLKVPGIFIAGENDTRVGNLAIHTAPLMQQARPKGALWSKIEVQGMGHEHRRTLHIFYPFFEKCLALRYPPEADPRQGPVTLRPIEEAQGWLADDGTWDSGWTTIAAYADFVGDRHGTETSWCLDEEMALLHRAYTSRQSRVEIRSEDELPWPAFCNNCQTIERAPGGKLLLAGQIADLEGWDSATLYDGATPVETIEKGGSRFWFQPTIDPKDTRRYRAYHVIVKRGAESFPSHMYTSLILPAAK